MITSKECIIAYNTLRSYCEESMDCHTCPINAECSARVVVQYQCPRNWPRIELPEPQNLIPKRGPQLVNVDVGANGRVYYKGKNYRSAEAARHHLQDGIEAAGQPRPDDAQVKRMLRFMRRFPDTLFANSTYEKCSRRYYFTIADLDKVIADWEAYFHDIAANFVFSRGE